MFEGTSPVTLTRKRQIREGYESWLELKWHNSINLATFVTSSLSIREKCVSRRILLKEGEVGGCSRKEHKSSERNTRLGQERSTSAIPPVVELVAELVTYTLIYNLHLGEDPPCDGE